MCRVKAIASSVERLLRYANCSGSSEAGSTEQMCSLTSFSKHLLKMGVRATGLQSFKHVILFFFGMGTMMDFMHLMQLICSYFTFDYYISVAYLNMYCRLS